MEARISANQASPTGEVRALGKIPTSFGWFETVGLVPSVLHRSCTGRLANFGLPFPSDVDEGLRPYPLMSKGSCGPSCGVPTQTDIWCKDVGFGRSS